MSGITMSSRTRSGCSPAIFCSASPPEAAVTTLCPRGASTASNRRMFWGVSSTTRILGWRSISAIATSAFTELPYLLWKRFDVDRFVNVAIESGVEESFSIVFHGECRQRNNRDQGCARLGPEAAKRRHPIHAGQLNVHEDQVGQMTLGEGDALFRSFGFEGAIALELQHVTHQLEILFVVFDDENEFTGHKHLGKVVTT